MESVQSDLGAAIGLILAIVLGSFTVVYTASDGFASIRTRVRQWRQRSTSSGIDKSLNS